MIFSLFAFAQIPVKCSNPRIRKDFRQVQQEGNWDKIINAFRTLKSSGKLTQMAQKHSDESEHIHNSMEFLTWHRRFIWELEDLIRGIGGNDLTLPYIDWAAEGDTYQGQIEQSTAFSEYFYGTFQDNQCVKGQIYESFDLAPQFGLGQCLARTVSTSVSINGWAAADQLIIDSASYQDFSHNLENSIHAYVHTRIGGAMGVMYSPIDPVFWGHHAFIDMMFLNYQYTHNQWDNNPDPIAYKQFSIFENSLTHQDSFKMDNQCVSYVRYTNSQSSPLSKRDVAASPTATQQPSATASADLSKFAPPNYQKYTSDQVTTYNAQLQTHYQSIRDGIANKSAPTDLYKQVTEFYPNSYISINNQPTDDEMKKLGLNPSVYNQVNALLNAQRTILSKLGNYNVHDLLTKIDHVTSPSAAFQMGIVFISLINIF